MTTLRTRRTYAHRIREMICETDKSPGNEGLSFRLDSRWRLVLEFRNGREIRFADRTHSLPMEIPERAAELILEEARAIAFATR